jgi:hypothetical protein
MANLTMHQHRGGSMLIGEVDLKSMGQIWWGYAGNLP